MTRTYRIVSIGLAAPRLAGTARAETPAEWATLGLKYRIAVDQQPIMLSRNKEPPLARYDDAMKAQGLFTVEAASKQNRVGKSSLNRRVFDDAPLALRAKIVALYVLLIAVNVAVWAWALIAFRHYPLLLGTAFLAYGFGLRHAVDADHIAAIDNVTRKLMQDGKRPATVGFFFSLGHSTIVLGASFLIAASAAAMQSRFDAFKETGELIGTGVSALFLFAIAIANLIVLRQVYAAYRRARRGETISDADLDNLLSHSGLLGRLFRPLFNLVRASWQLYFIGVLFGLGFDTATEIGLLDISAVEAAKGLSIWSIMVFPVLFTAAMALVDTSDGVLMLGAYGWAFRNPLRKLHYNITVTFVSAMVALLIGGIEALRLISDKLGLDGGFWRFVGALNNNFGSLGYAIVALFVLSWMVSVALYHRTARS